MGRTKKQIKVEDVKIEELDGDLNNEDLVEGVTKRGEILVGSKFKIIIGNRNYEIYEKKKVKTKDKFDNEVEVELFKSQEVYFGSLVNACNHLKQYIAKNKLSKKGTINSLDEAIKIIKESYAETQKMFEGIKDI